MGRERGTLLRWDDEKGFGFIRPHHGDMEIYFHIKSLPHYQRRPKIGDVLTYCLEMDERGRYYAMSAQIKGLVWSHFTLVWGCLGLLFATYVFLVVQQKLPFHFLAIYAAMSLLTIWAYSSDKRSAQLGEWRTSELKLHILEALGGWPGALLAQIFYRHKRQKLRYQIVFWLIVVSHGLLWYHVLTHQEEYRPYKEFVTEKIRILITSTNHKGLGRSTIPPLQGTRRVQGIVKEIRPGEGVVVSLERGLEGVIAQSTLVKNFPQLFKKDELIQVSVQAITFEGNQSRVELVLVDK